MITMLTQEQITKLNREICQEEASENPMITLIKASRRADLPFKDVMEYIITHALQDARNNISDTTNESPHIAP